MPVKFDGELVGYTDQSLVKIKFIEPIPVDEHGRIFDIKPIEVIIYQNK